jgi:hypothetical protein
MSNCQKQWDKYKYSSNHILSDIIGKEGVKIAGAVRLMTHMTDVFIRPDQREVEFRKVCDRKQKMVEEGFMRRIKEIGNAYQREEYDEEIRIRKNNWSRIRNLSTSQEKECKLIIFGYSADALLEQMNNGAEIEK